MIPIHRRSFMEPFVRAHANRLHRRSVSLCHGMGIDDYAEDAVQLAVIRVMARGRPIEERGPHSALRYVMQVLRCVCVDEWQRRQREPNLEPVDDRGDGTLASLSRALTDAGAAFDPAAVIDARMLTCAALLGCEYLPVYVETGYASAERNLRAFWLAAVEGMASADIAAELGVDANNRTLRARGKRHLLGWIGALAGVGAEDPNDNGSYRAAWRVGWRAGQEFVAERPDWWPRAEGLRHAR